MEDKGLREQVARIWDRNAAFWDERMGEGNDFVEVLVAPATERLLALQPGERVLDAACGNGLYARRLAAAGAEVVAFDIAPEMIARAQERGTHDGHIDYRVLDGTDEAALLALGEGSFDAAICHMALMDMPEIEPLMRALARLLRPQGRFVFSVLHPSFNSEHVTHMAELVEGEGKAVTVYSMKVRGYMTPTVDRGVAMYGQPEQQFYFHRPLQDLLGAGFRAGLVLDGLEERAFPPGHPGGTFSLSWNGHFSEFPAALVARLRPARV